MRERDATPSPATTVQVQDGRATFRRISPSEAILEVEYIIQPQTIKISGGRPAETVAAARDAELRRMQTILTGLGEKLEAKLDSRGKPTTVTRTWKNDEVRDWHRGDRAMQIDGARTQLVDRFTIPEGASEADVVREYFRLMVEQRVENIQDIYGKVLRDAFGVGGL